jgi:hypothetical protein
MPTYRKDIDDILISIELIIQCQAIYQGCSQEEPEPEEDEEGGDEGSEEEQPEPSA